MGYSFSWFSLSKSATETALNVSEILILVSGLLLAFGAIGEYLEEHNRLPRWIEWPKIVFIAFVVASLIGEFLGDGGVFVFSSHLQTISDGEFAVLNKEAGDARKEAGNAIALAGNISDRAEKLAGLLKAEHETNERFQRQSGVTGGGFLRQRLN